MKYLFTFLSGLLLISGNLNAEILKEPASFNVALTTTSPNDHAFSDFNTNAPYSFSGQPAVRKIDNQLILAFDSETLEYIDFAFSLSVELKNLKIYKNGASSPTSHPGPVILDISFDPTARSKYKEQALFHFEGGGKIEFDVTNIIYSSSTSSTMPANVQRAVSIRSEIVVERYHPFNSNDRLYPPDLKNTYDALTDQLTIDWNPIDGAEYYDLEWAYVDDYQEGYLAIPARNLKLSKHFDLDRNASRVQIDELRYTLPVTYENGYLLYRVRGVGKNYQAASDKVYTLIGQWSNPFDIAPDPTIQAATVEDWKTRLHIPAPHESDNKNWQIITSYAENGLRKDVVSYMDGTYRNRQSVTGLSTDNMTLVGESIYDHEGRAAIQVLPVPINDETLKYYQNLNQNKNSSPSSYTWKNFDITGTNCVFEPEPMNTISGTSRYYSSNNNNPDPLNINAYIPDAEEYPFVQTEFTPDQTGRVRRQSGAGYNHKFGSGHETQYYYGTPSQEELCSWFGNEVGFAAHYKKNVAQDPNGQLSVSVSDLKGNVVATALAGECPVNLEELESFQVISRDIDLLAFNTSWPNERKIEAQRSFTVVTPGEHEFRYTMSHTAYEELLCNGIKLCMDCTYDLKLQVVDNYECDPVKAMKFDTLLQVGPFDPANAIDDSCPKAGVSFDSDNLLPQPPMPFTLDLDVGSYTVLKRLSINTEATDSLVHHFMKRFKEECSYKYDSILQVQMDQIDLKNCEIEDDGKKENRCEIIREAMKMDLAPGGQYGLLDFANYSSNDPLSIYNLSNKLPETNATWQNPQHANRPDYYDENNNLIQVHDPSDGNMKSPKNLALKEFIALWDPQWAESLLYLHPEYCYLKWCSGEEASFDFDNDLLLTNTFVDAKQNGFIDPGNHLVPSGSDPYFNGGGGNLNQFQGKLTNYNTGPPTYKMIQLAAMTAFAAANQPYDSNWLTAIGSNPNINPNVDANYFWETYRALYLSKKEELQYNQRRQSAMNCGGYNECIGVDPDPFNWTKNGFANKFLNSTNKQPCNITTFQLYSKKAIRFPSAYNVKSPDFDPYDFDFDALLKARTEAQLLIGQQCDSCFCNIEIRDLVNNILLNRPDLDQLNTIMLPNILVNDFLVSRISIMNGNAQIKKITYQLDTSGDLAISFIDGNTQTVCLLKLIIDNNMIPHDKAFNWVDHSDYISCILYEEPAQGINTYEAKSTLYLNQHTTEESFPLKITSTCPIFDVCRPPGEDCPPEPILADVGQMLNRLMAVDSIMGPTNVYPYLVGDLKAEFPNPGMLKLVLWQTTLAGNKLKGTLQGGSNPRKCTITLDLPSGVNANDLQLITKLTPDNTKLDLATGYTYDAIAEIRLRNGQTIEANLNNGCFPFSYCEREEPDEKTILECIQELELPEEIEEQLTLDLLGNQGGKKKNKLTKKSLYHSDELDGLDIHDPNKLIDHCKQITSKYDSLRINTSFVTKVDCNPCLWEIDSLPSMPLINDCVRQLINGAEINAHFHWQRMLDSIESGIRNRYVRHCMGPKETFRVKYDEALYHMTLYYYDQANNLLKTIPPKGVKPLDVNQTNDAIAHLNDNNLPTVYPAHEMASDYTFNSLNQLVHQTIPDHIGATVFFYDWLGRIVASQNPEQATKQQYSYSLYDDLGRVFEAGAIGQTGLTDAIAKNTTQFDNWINAGTKTEITHSTYDAPLANVANSFFNGDASNYRNRISSVQYFETDVAQATHSTHYKYDIHGNVKTLVQDLELLEAKTMEYDYDLISGNVNEVRYQPGKVDQFTHQYKYDADNRLKDVQTSRDGYIWDKDAKYEYYQHGPLARVELGENKVQGVDYAYTIQGWIKGVNSATLNEKVDIGQDGHTGADNEEVARDATGYMLRYFSANSDPQDFRTNDYKMIGSAPAGIGWEPAYAGTAFERQSRDLFNGNIQSMITAISGLKGGNIDFKQYGYAYHYDQLNRIKGMDTYTGLDVGGNKWLAGNLTQRIDDYKTRYTFDGNGNIETLLRNGTAQNGNSFPMDKLSYTYTPGTNRLEKVDDVVGPNNYKNIDIDTQVPNNYQYDNIGNLILDQSNDDLPNPPDPMAISWNVSGKVKEMKRTVSGDAIKLSYGPMGNRVTKHFENIAQTKDEYTFYILDATGNVMATYQAEDPNDVSQVKYQSAYVYGSSRLGEERIDATMAALEAKRALTTTASGASTTVSVRSRGAKYYELSNHLNNVLSTVSDRKLATSLNNNTTDHFVADVWTASDYYPYGKMMVERHEEGLNHNSRFGFNGMEKDDELRKSGNSYTTEFRQYNPDLGRWLSLDPLMAKYPSQTPFAGFNNCPIFFADPTGLEGDDQVTTNRNEKGQVVTPNGYGADFADDWYSVVEGNLVMTNGTDYQVWNSGTGHYEAGRAPKNHKGSSSTNYDYVPADLQIGDTYNQYLYDKYGVLFTAANDSRLLRYVGDLNWVVESDFKSSTNRKIAASFLPIGVNNIRLLNWIRSTFAGKEIISGANLLLKGQVKKLINSQKISFWVGHGTEQAALKEGFRVIGNTNAGKNMNALTAGFSQKQTTRAWDRLSAALAYSFKEGSTAHVFIQRSFVNHPKFKMSTWKRIEENILKEKGVKIIRHYID